MKKLLIASFLSAASATAFAQQQPMYPIDQIPPTVQQFSEDAAKVSNILLRPEIKDCVKQFNKTGASISSVTAQFQPAPGEYLDPQTGGYKSGTTEYKFTGYFPGKYEQAVATLIVDETEKQVKTGPGKGSTRIVRSYSCNVMIAD